MLSEINKNLPPNVQIENVSVDRVVLKFKDVTTDEFNNLQNSLIDLMESGYLYNVKSYQNASARSYLYNINIPVDEVVATEGAIYIGYLHNSNKNRLNGNSFNMKMEFNPNKATHINQMVLLAIKQCLKNKQVELTDLDIAIDVPYPIKDVYSVSNKSRNTSSNNTTRYYGEQHKHGYLKIYDKTKERLDFIKSVNKARKKQGLDELDIKDYVPDHEVTRIEVTLCPSCKSDEVDKKAKEGVTFKQLQKHRFDFDSLYSIGVYGEDQDMVFRCVMYAIMDSMSGIEAKDFPRGQKNKLKKQRNELQETNGFRLNYILKSCWQQLCESIESYFFTDKAEQEHQELVLAFKECSSPKPNDRELYLVNPKTGQTFENHFDELIAESPNREKEISEAGQQIALLNKQIIKLDEDKNQLLQQKHEIKQQYKLELENKKILFKTAIENKI